MTKQKQIRNNFANLLENVIKNKIITFHKYCTFFGRLEI